EVGDVARDRRLRRVEPALTQTAPHLFLAVQRFVIDGFEDDGLTSCFHGDSVSQEYTICVECKHDYSSISIDFSDADLYKYSFRCIPPSTPAPPAAPAPPRKPFALPSLAPRATRVRNCCASFRAIRRSRSSPRHRRAPRRRRRENCP